MIGINENNWLVYEGSSNYGHGVWPSPVILKATFLETENDWKLIPKSHYLRETKFVFREDSFDAATRVRRGRVYEWQDGNMQPEQWFVQAHPALAAETGQRDFEGRFSRTLLTYRPIFGLGRRLAQNTRLMLGLGTIDVLSIWKIISVEKVASGEDLLTLRARSNLGALPDLKEESLPEKGKNFILASVDRVVNAAYRSDPTSIVDHCRDSAQVLLSHWLVQENMSSDIVEKDLGQVIATITRKFPDGRKLLVNAADIIRRLHPRGKSNEQHRLDIRAPVEQDAELALSSLGLILRDLGWTK